ncbi:MAG: RES domain-containing protein [Lewinellaceae bacterium]|nr:RES domain-containing protein [Saprospiraceae bacterium]MCB9341069.1 RES domain-containing protein [Lewinellaceae bacterium]
MNEQEKSLSDLKIASSKLSDIEYDEIIELIKNSIRLVPVTTAKLKEGALIDRVRVNTDRKLFYKEDDISYIKDECIIAEKLIEYGRANKPHEVMFYGALESSEIPQQRATAIMETVRLLKDKDAVNIEGLLVTMGRWEVQEEIEIVEMVFCTDTIRSNPDVKKAFEYHFERMKFHPMRELALLQLDFFSSEFAKKVENNNDYKVSVAYTDLMLNGKGFAGITYPSVQSGHKGQNIVLKPEIVDKHLKLTLAGTLMIYKNKMKTVVNNHKYALEFGENNSKFNWLDVAAKDVACMEDIMIQLGFQN